MSVATDIRTRAEDVLEHSKQILTQAQTRLTSDERYTAFVGKAESAYGSVSEAVSGHVIKPAKELIAKSPLAARLGSAPAEAAPETAESDPAAVVTPIKKPTARKPAAKKPAPPAEGDDAILE